MSTWSAAILTGGRARRLDGRVKPLLDVGGVAIVERQRAMLATLGAVPRLITPDPRPFAHLGLEIVADLVDAGALGGLCTALETAATDVVVVLAGDMPFVHARFVQALLTLLGAHDAVVPRTAHDGWQPLAAAYRRSLGPHLRRALADGERRVIAVVAALDVATLNDAALAPLDPDGTLLCNVNTPDDYERARRFAAGRAEPLT